MAYVENGSRIGGETTGTVALQGYVDNLSQTAPAGFINPETLKTLASQIDIVSALDNLPHGLTHDDFVGINMLSALTECQTARYANVFDESGQKYDAPWLSQFTRDVWEPDEMGHHDPFQQLLKQAGVPEDVIANEVARVQSMDYIHRNGDRPEALTVYGMVQEYLTKSWYKDTREILRELSPEAAQMVRLVEQREALHTKWYRDMTAIQIEANPELIPNVATSLLNFQMPGNSFIPELTEKGAIWLPQIHDGDLSAIKKELVWWVNSALGGDTKNLGKLFIEMGAESESWLERVSLRSVRAGLNRFGLEDGYGILGEGVLHAVGLDNLYEKPNTDAGRVRQVFRNFVARQVNSSFDSQFGFEPQKA